MKMFFQPEAVIHITVGAHAHTHTDIHRQCCTIMATLIISDYSGIVLAFGGSQFDSNPIFWQTTWPFSSAEDIQHAAITCFRSANTDNHIWKSLLWQHKDRIIHSSMHHHFHLLPYWPHSEHNRPYPPQGRTYLFISKDDRCATTGRLR